MVAGVDDRCICTGAVEEPGTAPRCRRHRTPPGRSKCSDPARIPSPDLCRTTSSRQELAIDAVQVVEARREPCTSASRPGTERPPRSGLQIDDHRLTLRLNLAHLDGRSSRPGWSCREPPFAPKNTSVVAAGFAPCARSRGAQRCGAPLRRMVSSAGGHTKNSLAPARIACRIRSGPSLSATAKIVWRRAAPAPEALDGCRARTVASAADVHDHPRSG